MNDKRAQLSDSWKTDLIGTSPAMQRLHAMIARVAKSDLPVLVTGPTGSGKELVVRAIHALGSNSREPLLDINCGALPQHLVESELFGHERGAFTSADRKSDGLLAAVGRGTFFMDEMGELPMMVQPKLLRVLESRRFRSVGAVEDREFKGRIIAATHADLKSRVAEGRFREDLFFRLNVFVIQVPSLAERAEDIGLLANMFASRRARPFRFSEDAIARLRTCKWPGNVRELRNFVDRVDMFVDREIVFGEDLDRLENLPEGYGQADGTGPNSSIEKLIDEVLGSELENKVDTLERMIFARAFNMCRQNKSRTARMLGVHRKVIERQVKKHGLEPSVL